MDPTTYSSCQNLENANTVSVQALAFARQIDNHPKKNPSKPGRKERIKIVARNIGNAVEKII